MSRVRIVVGSLVVAVVVAAFSSCRSPAAESTSIEPKLDEPTAAAPVVAVATLTPERVVAGETTLLTIYVRTAPTWHIYGRRGARGANAATEIDVALPEGCVWVDDWSDPPLERDPASHAEIHRGRFSFRRHLRIGAASRTGACELAGTLSYQACDPMMCRPPESIALHVKLIVAAH